MAFSGARLALCLFLFHQHVFPCAGQPLEVFIAHDRAAVSNGITISWRAVPGDLYNVFASSALGTNWQVLNTAPIFSSNTIVQFPASRTSPMRFYRVEKADTLAPAIRPDPGSNSVAVGLSEPLRVYVTEQTGLDLESVLWLVSTNLLRFPDARLSYSNRVLTYTPNEPHGIENQEISNRLILADVLGHRSTNEWSFKLERTPVLSPNVILIPAANSEQRSTLSRAAQLTLLDQLNDHQYIFGFDGESSGVQVGTILVSTDAENPYQMKVFAFEDYPAEQTVWVAVGPASLAECFSVGSIAFWSWDIFNDFASYSFHDLDLADNENLRTSIGVGQWEYNPAVVIRASWQDGVYDRFDAAFSGYLTVIMSVDALAKREMVASTISRSLLPTPWERKRLIWLGNVPIELTARETYYRDSFEEGLPWGGFRVVLAPTFE